MSIQHISYVCWEKEREKINLNSKIFIAFKYYTSYERWNKIFIIIWIEYPSHGFVWCLENQVNSVWYDIKKLNNNNNITEQKNFYCSTLHVIVKKKRED